MEEKSNIPKWLKNLQENSWEVELLISGGAIFSLFQISDFFLDFVLSLKMTSHVPGTGIFIIMGMLGIKILTIGFFFHLFLRAIWLGMVCINYVFPLGISSRKKNYAKPFTSKFSPNDNLFHEIQRVDRASGLVMFFSILSFIVILGILLVTIVLVTLPFLFFSQIDFILSWIPFILLAYIFDLLFFGVLRKIPLLSYLTYPVFWVIDRISFRTFYEKPLRLMSSNLKRKHAVFGFSAILLAAILFTYSNVYQLMHWPNLLDPRDHPRNLTEETNWMYYGFYMDDLKRYDKKAPGPVIQSELVKDNFLKVFIPYNKNYDYLNEDSQEPLANYILLDINDVKIENIKWYSYRAPFNDQLGFRTMIDISNFEKGHYQLRIYDEEEQIDMIIPFWKEN